MLVGEQTLLAMREAWLAAPLADLAERLMCALESGDNRGGDFRGKQSAALKIVGREAYANVDLRVDEHPEPVRELRRVLQIARQQLFPFVRGMTKRTGATHALGTEVTSMLMLPPKNRSPWT
jgi:uncharacterized Ntn-hydrolase superfamily protein